MSRVSVVIPLYNAAEYIVEALASIRAQSYSDVEIIVVDDGSTDDGIARVRDFDASISVLTQPNQGPGAARNAGVRRCSGDFLAFLDADDVWVPDKLEAQLEVFRRRPDVDFVFGRARQFVSTRQDSAPDETYTYIQEVMMAHLPSAMLARRTSFLDVGLFSSGRIGTEIDWYMRAREAGKRIVELERILYNRRIHGENTGIVFRDDEREKLKVLRNALRRRRDEASSRPS